MHQTIVIVIGGNHHNTLGLIRSIGEKGFPVYLFLEHQVSLSTCNLRFSKYITKMYHLRDEDEIMAILERDFHDEEQRPIILCASDASVCLLDAHYNELKDKFLFFNAGEQGRISYFMNKLNTFPVAEACGLKIIKTWQLKASDSIPEDVVYPCFSKANNSVTDGKNASGINYSEVDLRERFKHADDLLVQEYIDKEYEIDINGFSYKHGEQVVINAVCCKIRDYVDRQSQYDVLEDISLYPDLDIRAIGELVKAIGYEGLFSIEFMRANGKFYFLEINLRNDGVNYIYTKSGYNYPYLWYLYGEGKLSNEHTTLPELNKPVYVMSWSDFSDVIHGQLSFTRWLKDFLRTRAFFVLNRKDPKPFLYLIWQNVKHKLHI